MRRRADAVRPPLGKLTAFYVLADADRPGTFGKRLRGILGRSPDAGDRAEARRRLFPSWGVRSLDDDEDQR